MTFKHLSNIIKKLKEKPDNIIADPNLKETERARELLEQLRAEYTNAYKRRKENWFRQHPDQQFFSPALEEARRDTELQEWVWYFIERVYGMTNEQRYYAALELGDTEEEAQKEKNKTVLDILNDYRDYPEFDKVLKVWTEQ